MKQQDLDSIHELDAGWGDDDLEDSSPAPSARISDKPYSPAPSGPETDDLDAGWDDAADEVPRRAEPVALAGARVPKAVPSAARSARSGPPGQTSSPQTPASARAAFKKAHRELAKKNQEHARRRKKLRKAERKAQRQQAAREARAERERKARAEREQKARAEAERKARRQQAAVSQARSTGAGRRVTPARTDKRSGRALDARGEARQESTGKAARRPKRDKRKRLRAKERAKRQRARLWLLVALGVLVVLGVAWLLARR